MLRLVAPHASRKRGNHMWIGVIGDTTGVLQSNVFDVFDGVDYILHCGTIGDPQILDDLSQIAPIAGVISTQDDPELYPFDRTLRRQWFDVGIYVCHRIGDPMNLQRNVEKEIEEFEPEVVLFGGGPEAFNNRVEGRLFFNPGSAGRRRAKQPRSVGLLEIDGHSVRAEVVPLDESALAINGRD